MLSYVQIDNNTVNLSNRAAILKKDDYQTLLAHDEILDQARIQATSIIDEANREAVEIKERAHQEGLNISEKEAGDRMASIMANYYQYLSSIENEIASLVIGSVKQVISDTDNNEIIYGVVKKSLEKMSQEKQIKISVSIDDLDTCREFLDKLYSEFPNIEFIEIKGNPNFSQGDCRIECPVGVLDAKLEDQLDNLERNIRQQFSRT